MINYLIDEDIMSNVMNVVVIAAVLAAIIIFLYSFFFRKLKNMENRLQIMEKEFEIIRERSRSNLMVYRKVVDGLDEIIGHMKVSVEEEEKKVALIKINEQATTEHIEKTKRHQRSEERHEG
jgi:Tfp pilus assembly protein PilE